jgi:uncharacterized protein
MTQFDEITLTGRLDALPAQHRVAFAVSCCERLVPNYRAFHFMEKWGDPSILDGALSALWGSVLGARQLDRSSWQYYVSRCESVTPDTEDFYSVFAGPAQCACAAIIYAIETLLTGNPSQAALAGRLAYETVDMYVRSVDDPIHASHPASPQFDKWLETHPLLTAELNKQDDDLSVLESNAILSTDLIVQLRRSSAESGLQPFARGMVVPNA